MSQTVSLIKCSSLQSRPDFLWLPEGLFCFPDPNYHFLRPQKLTWSPPHGEKVILECCISLWSFMKHSHLSIFSPLHPWQTVVWERERERACAHFQTLPSLLYFTLSLNVSPEASDRHASVYELTLNRWGEETDGGGDKEQQPPANLWRLFFSWTLCAARTNKPN